MKKIFTVIGARPQFIKAATISNCIISKYSQSLEEVIVHTGQHYDDNMSEVFFDEMNIPTPKYRLHTGGKSHGAMTGEMLTELEKLMLLEQPDLVLIYGDTNSTLAAAISASKLHIPVAHVEAGIRAFDKRIPEEVNRVLSDHVSSLFFCTSQLPADNLRNEGLKDGIHIVGDVMYDLVLTNRDKVRPSDYVKNITGDFYLVTCHRQENTDNESNLKAIFRALKTLSEDTKIIIPLHPRTAGYIKKYGIDTTGITLIEPVGYYDMLYLIKHSKLILTDSGGLQKEAYYCGKPSVIMRDATEWTELLECGVAALTGADEAKILKATKDMLQITNFPGNIYGDGHAAEHIVKILDSF